MPSSHDDVSIAHTLLAAKFASPREREFLESEVISFFQPMTHALARRYCQRGVEIEDLEQVADLGLLKAMRRYDPAAGHLRSYVAATVLGEVKKYFRDYGWAIRPPRHIQDLQAQVVDAVVDAGEGASARPRADRVADALGVDRAVVTEVLMAREGFRCLSLELQAGHGRSRLSDRLADQDDPFVESERRLLLRSICASLSDHDRDLLRMRFVEELSQPEIAARMDSSQKQVSRALERLLASLRESATSEAA